MWVIGEAFEDWIFSGLSAWPDPGHEIKTDDLQRCPGGGAVITSVAAARLGIPVHLLSALGAEHEALLVKEGVHVKNLAQAGDIPAVTIALTTSKNRSFLTYNGANSNIESRFFEALKTLAIPTGTHIHCAFEPQSPALWAEWVVSQRQAAGITVSWDFGWSEALATRNGISDLVSAVDLLFLNEDETLLYSGVSQWDHAIQYWKGQQRCVIIRRAERGAEWVCGDSHYHALPPVVEVRDPTGAGDAFNAGFLCAWTKGFDPQECLTWGNRLGSAAVTAVGGIAGLPHGSIGD